ncbi:MAG: outer membrane protein OmpA-like peptidoglycan-associated protein [Myxococcota bacterium]|jgi:outer membrane protein OmpA-like peptidoglycan-associated protein
MKVMREVAQALGKHPEFTHVSIKGHTDRSGDAAFSMQLSLLRAWAVKRVLAREGVERSRLFPGGFGQTTPRNVGARPEQRALNRRVPARADHRIEEEALTEHR